MGWVSRITKYMRNRRDYELLYAKMAKAERLCRSLYEKYPGEMLLHGDLHHYNILLGGEGRWRVIDPKGVVGDPVFDLPRFVLNEFADGYDESLPRVLQTLSEKLHIPQGDLMRLTFVETCMAHCWVAESGQEPNVGQVLLLEAMMDNFGS
jgi:streptomycin 6-kinase